MSKVALVTGAWRGIGRSIALALGAAGCAVVVTEAPDYLTGEFISFRGGRL